MTIIGALVATGTWLIGLPAPLALGMMAGLFEFVPIVGSFAGAIPALIFALSEESATIWCTLLLFVGVQQLESIVVSPLLMQGIVHLPPAIVLFAVLAGGTLFGLQGIFLAVPLAILVHVLVVTFYVRRMLHEDAVAPGGTS